MTNKDRPDWIAIEGAYRSGKGSLREIGGEYGVTEGAIRARAKKHGWMRDPEGTKRERVRAIMSGVSQSVTQDALRTIETEAENDAADMQMGLDVARICLRRLSEIAQDCADAKEIKVIVESNRIAIDTIRRVRGLDSERVPDTPISGFRMVPIK
jgi:hypothetical protein